MMLENTNIEKDSGFRLDKIKLKQSVQDAISSSVENFARDITVLIENDFKTASRFNIKELLEKYNMKVTNINNYMTNRVYFVKRHFDRADEIIDEANDIIDPLDDPYYEALLEFREVISIFADIILHRVLVNNADRIVMNKMAQLIDDAKKLDLENLKMSSDKVQSETMLGITQTFLDNEREKEKSRKEIQLLSDQINMLKEKLDTSILSKEQTKSKMSDEQLEQKQTKIKQIIQEDEDYSEIDFEKENEIVEKEEKRVENIKKDKYEDMKLSSQYLITKEQIKDVMSKQNDVDKIRTILTYYPKMSGFMLKMFFNNLNYSMKVAVIDSVKKEFRDKSV